MKEGEKREGRRREKRAGRQQISVKEGYREVLGTEGGRDRNRNKWV